MDLKQMFLERHTTLHGHMTESDLLGGLSDADLRARPHGVNSIVWLLWHVARCEDGAVNRFVAGWQQLIDREPWMERMNVPFRHRGTGMTSAAVDDFSGRVDVAALRAYWDAVGANTREIVAQLDPDCLDEMVTWDVRRRVFVDEGLASEFETVPERPIERNRGWYLAFPGLTHGHYHFAEGMVTRGLIARERT
jgi:hypothetical protein